MHTRFEVARILGARALQISMGAPTIIPRAERFLDPLGLGFREYENMLIPITARRLNDDTN